MTAPANPSLSPILVSPTLLPFLPTSTTRLALTGATEPETKSLQKLLGVISVGMAPLPDTILSLARQLC
jgi:hypothetical protein